MNFERLLVTDFCSNNFSKISLAYLIISIQADTRNFGKKYQQIFLQDAIFFEQWGPCKRQFSKVYLPSMKFGIFRSINELYLLFSLQSFSAIVLKTKDENFVTAKCACINDGATLTVKRKEFFLSVLLNLVDKNVEVTRKIKLKKL